MKRRYFFMGSLPDDMPAQLISTPKRYSTDELREALPRFAEWLETEEAAEAGVTQWAPGTFLDWLERMGETAPQEESDA